jgi:hypothetical protein
MLPETNVNLTPDQISQIEQARKLIPALKAQIRKAKSAGIELTAQEAELATLESQLEKIYRVYIRNPGNTIGT